MQILRILFLVTLTGSQAAVSPDGRCGKLNNDYSCLGTAYGDCCSSYGFCGSLYEHCGYGCDPAYGSCTGYDGIIPTVSGAGPTPTAPSETTPCPGIPIGKVYEQCMAIEALQCYELPYGGLGVLSDVLTVYTVIMLARGYSPWFPKRRLGGRWFDIFLGIASMGGTVTSVIHTMVRCSRGAHWSFVLLGAWRGLLSLSLGFMTIHAAITHDFPSIGRWLIFYSLGLTLGIAGLSHISFTSPNGLRPAFSNRIPVALMITALISGTVIPVLFYSYFYLRVNRRTANRTLKKLLWVFRKDDWVDNDEYWPWIPFAIYYAMSFGILIALASDGILASIAQNPWGVPSKNQATFFWIYFAFKRLPSFSM